MTTTEQRLADALRALLAHVISADVHATPAGGKGILAYGRTEYSQVTDAHAALAAYDAQQAQAVEYGAWAAEPITNVVSAPPLPSRAYREPVASCNSAEYAERIAACVNACAGMTTAEVLEFGAPGELGRCAQAWVAEDNDNA